MHDRISHRLLGERRSLHRSRSPGGATLFAALSQTEHLLRELVVVANGIASEELSVRIAMHCEDHRYIGKVKTVRYDRFGDFDGFSIETMNGVIRHFDSHESRIGD
jgi:hypothetical protein